MAQVEANGIRIEAESRGDAADPAILVIRGLGTQMVQWPESFLAGLTDAGFRVLIFDNRDVGLSQKFDAAGAPDLGAIIAAVASGEPPPVAYLVDDMAADAVGVLDAFDVERAHVFGISMGGMIAQVIAAKYPERVRSLFSVMSSSGDPSVPPATPEAMAVLTSRPDDPTSRTSVIEHGLKGRRVIGSAAFRDDDDTVRAQLGVAYDRCHHPEGVARQMAAIMASGSRVPLLGRITAPTLVIHGTNDPLVHPEGGRSTAKHIPGASLEMVEGMAHDIPSRLVPKLLDLIVRHAKKADGSRSATQHAR